MDRRYQPLFALLSIFTTLFLSHIILAWLDWNTAFRMIAALTGVIAMSAPLFVHLDQSRSTAAFSSCILCGVFMSIGWSWAQTDRVLTWMAVYTALIPLILGLSMFILETYSMDSKEVIV
ncbi:MAG: hypothetical protein CMB77_02145 [Euryarchaeota archaeon]|nr:hypothetical protein [Euryarchaeota archaeon]